MKHLSILLRTVWSLFMGVMQLVPWRSKNYVPGTLGLQEVEALVG